MFKTHFYGQEISSYGRENGYVDYRSFASAFDAVLNNEIISKTADSCYWENENYPDNTEEIEELEEKQEAIQAEADEYENRSAEASENGDPIGAGMFFDLAYEGLTSWAYDIETERENLECYEPEVFQWYIVSYSGAELIQRFTDNPLYYSEELDMYVWGVTHYGTAWDYVLTDIPCEKKVDEA